MLLLKIKNNKDFEEVEVDIMEEDVQTEVEVVIRVFISEEKRFNLTLKRPANDKIKILAEELGDLLRFTKYELTFFYKGDKVGLNERLGDREIGGRTGENFLLCLKGGSEGPKAWKRFTTVDDPCR